MNCLTRARWITRFPVDMATPYDDDLIRMNRAPMCPMEGNERRVLPVQAEQDVNAAKLAAPVSAERAATKGTSLYRSSDWDLVDALEDKRVSVDKLDRSELPEELRSNSSWQLHFYVEQKKKKRQDVKSQIAENGRKRDAYLLQKQKESFGSKTLGTAILENIRAQACEKKFTYKEGCYDSEKAHRLQTRYN
jgi:hypothetical protein